MENKGNMIETLNLPEVMIQHIQSFMREKEAVRSSILSKSWYDAWLTRPTLNIDERDNAPRELMTKTMKRYQDLNVKIESLRLRDRSRYRHTNLFSRDLLVEAMKMGATNVELEIELPNLTLPPEVLGSKTFLGLSMTSGYVDARALIRCSRLKSLALKKVCFVRERVFKDIISCCISMEELSLSSCGGLAALSFMYEIRKLRRLFLEDVDDDSMFFADFESRFPCLKDLAILDCRGYSTIKIASTSLETISFRPLTESKYATFEVPNIRRFTYNCIDTDFLDLLSIEGALREWELDLSLFFYGGKSAASRCRNLKDLLAKFSLSRISFFIRWVRSYTQGLVEVGVAVVPKLLVLENLSIFTFTANCADFALFYLFGICRPKFITQFILHYLVADQCSNETTAFKAVYKRLMQQLVTPHCGIPDQDMFGELGLRRVNMEVYETFDDNVWQPLILKAPLDVTNTPKNKQKVRFELVWDC